MDQQDVKPSEDARRQASEIESAPEKSNSISEDIAAKPTDDSSPTSPPQDESVAPEEEAVAPKEEYVSPEEEAVSPKEEEKLIVEPSKEDIAPSDSVAAERQESEIESAPEKSNSISEDIAAKPTDESSPTSPPQDESVAPEEEAVAPKEEAVAPKEEYVSPKEEEKQIVEPSKEDIAPSDSVAATNAPGESKEQSEPLAQTNVEDPSNNTVVEPPVANLCVENDDSLETLLTKAKSLVNSLQQTQENPLLVELQFNLAHVAAKNESQRNENTTLRSQNDQHTNEIETLQRQLLEERKQRASQIVDFQKMKQERDDHERRQLDLTNRLNAAKKKEAVKADLAEQYEDGMKQALQELHTAKTALTETSTSKERLVVELMELRMSSGNRIRQTELALADERALNEERKRKMKLFVESKSEEIHIAKLDNDALQNELNQTNASLKDLNIRWKQLHAQWVQSQTRNRELQRDLNRIKKDTENLHKAGETVSMKLSRSATETEEHKNKRLAAKNELMTVLRTLEAERELGSKLRDSIKFTFTPKALSQQQLLHEGLQEFESQLSKLSERLRQPLPPPLDESTFHEPSESDDFDLLTAGDEESDSNDSRLVAKLEYETQRVSQCIMALSGSMERMNLLLTAQGNRTCYSVFNELITTGAYPTRTVAHSSSETTSMTGRESQLASIRSLEYR
jgi:hypothetical protein